jgi:sugar lactone lactonase YvrE
MQTTLSSNRPQRRSGAAKVGLLLLLAVGVAAAAVPAALVAMKNNEAETTDGATVGAPSQFSAGKGGPTHVAPDGKCPGAIALEKRGFDAPPGRAKDGGGEPVDPLAVVNECIYPTRIAEGPGGKFYVTDAKVGSVFIYDAALQVTGELKGLDGPLGVAVGADGRIYVGNDGRDNVEVYSPAGAKLATLASGVQMPNDMAIDPSGSLYVADSRGGVVKAYDTTGALPPRSIGADAGLVFPIALAVSHGSDANGNVVNELYVADPRSFKIYVFDLQGNFLRAYGGMASKSMMGGFKWHGKFIKLQSLAIDAQGRLHAADCYMHNIQILNPETGAYLSSYGTYGTEPGALNLPLDIVIAQGGQAVVTNALSSRVEAIPTGP